MPASLGPRRSLKLTRADQIGARRCVKPTRADRSGRGTSRKPPRARRIWSDRWVKPTRPDWSSSREVGKRGRADWVSPRRWLEPRREIGRHRSVAGDDASARVFGATCRNRRPFGLSARGVLETIAARGSSSRTSSMARDALSTEDIRTRRPRTSFVGAQPTDELLSLACLESVTSSAPSSMAP